MYFTLNAELNILLKQIIQNISTFANKSDKLFKKEPVISVFYSWPPVYQKCMKACTPLLMICFSCTITSDEIAPFEHPIERNLSFYRVALK